MGKEKTSGNNEYLGTIKILEFTKEVKAGKKTYTYGIVRVESEELKQQFKTGDRVKVRIDSLGLRR